MPNFSEIYLGRGDFADERDDPNGYAERLADYRQQLREVAPGRPEGY